MLDDQGPQHAIRWSWLHGQTRSWGTSRVKVVSLSLSISMHLHCFIHNPVLPPKQSSTSPILCETTAPRRGAGSTRCLVREGSGLVFMLSHCPKTCQKPTATGKLTHHFLLEQQKGFSSKSCRLLALLELNFEPFEIHKTSRNMQIFISKVKFKSLLNTISML